MEPFHWKVPEYTERERSVDWFWGLGLGAVAIAGLSIFFGNYLFAVLIIIAALSLALFAIRKPQDVEYEISDKGFRSGDTLYPFSTLSSFWVEERHHYPKLILASKKVLVPYIVVPIAEHDPQEIRAELLQHLPEEEHHEPLLHIIAERLGL